MKKKFIHSFFALFLALCILTGISSVTPTAYASDTQPYFLSMSKYTVKIEISNTGYVTGTCSAILLASTSSATITMKLQQQKNDMWVTLNTWTYAGGPRLEFTNNCYVTSGYDYRIDSEITVYDSAGNKIETQTQTSEKKHF